VKDEKAIKEWMAKAPEREAEKEERRKAKVRKVLRMTPLQS
jgi:hypothetical protein